MIWSQVMRPSVRVPVLSVAITVTDPRVSTAGSRRPIAWRRAIRCAPNASATVTTAGSDSGTAATVRLTATSTISGSARPRSSPATSTTADSATATAPSSQAQPREPPLQRRQPPTKPMLVWSFCWATARTR